MSRQRLADHGEFFGRAARFQPDPAVRIGSGLALDEGIAGSAPGFDGVGEIVEDQIAVIRPGHQDEVSLIVGVEDHGQQQRRTRPAGLHKQLLFQKDVVVAIAGAVVRVGPPVDDAELVDSVMIVVADTLNLVIDQAVDLLQLRSALLVDRDKFFTLLARHAFRRLRNAEAGPADGCIGIGDDTGKLMRLSGGIRHGFCCRGCRKQQAGDEEKAGRNKE